MAEQLRSEPEISKQPAIDFLNYVQGLKFRKNQKPEKVRAFFEDINLGSWFTAIIETFSRIPEKGPSLQTMRGRHNDQAYLAVFYPGNEGIRPKPDSAHINFGPPGMEQNITSLTFLVGRGLPLAQRSVIIGSYGRSRIDKLEDPREIFKEVQNLASIMGGAWVNEAVDQSEESIAA